jgi:hypothetical protein
LERQEYSPPIGGLVGLYCFPIGQLLETSVLSFLSDPVEGVDILAPWGRIGQSEFVDDLMDSYLSGVERKEGKGR